VIKILGLYILHYDVMLVMHVMFSVLVICDLCVHVCDVRDVICDVLCDVVSYGPHDA